MTVRDKRLGVVIVCYNSLDVVIHCLQSLISSDAEGRLCICIVDNASADESVSAIRTLLETYNVSSGSGAPPGPDRFNVVERTFNGGYAAAVNDGLDALFRDHNLDAVWVLNPDCIVSQRTVSSFIQRACSSEPFGLLSSRCLLGSNPAVVQTDGGVVSRRTGVCSSVNAGRNAATTDLPNAASLDFVSGANFVISRAFYETVGPMDDTYFLYYEEVDWAFKRSSFSIELLPDAEVIHHGGTSIGSATLTQQASPLANYFSHRNRIRFVSRHFPMSLPTALLWTVGKGIQVLLKAGLAPAAALTKGALQLAPTKTVSNRIIGEEARRKAFSKTA